MEVKTKIVSFHKNQEISQLHKTISKRTWLILLMKLLLQHTQDKILHIPNLKLLNNGKGIKTWALITLDASYLNLHPKRNKENSWSLGVKFHSLKILLLTLIWFTLTILIIWFISEGIVSKEALLFILLHTWLWTAILQKRRIIR